MARARARGNRNTEVLGHESNHEEDISDDSDDSEFGSNSLNEEEEDDDPDSDGDWKEPIHTPRRDHHPTRV